MVYLTYIIERIVIFKKWDEHTCTTAPSRKQIAKQISEVPYEPRIYPAFLMPRGLHCPTFYMNHPLCVFRVLTYIYVFLLSNGFFFKAYVLFYHKFVFQLYIKEIISYVFFCSLLYFLLALCFGDSLCWCVFLSSSFSQLYSIPSV